MLPTCEVAITDRTVGKGLGSGSKEPIARLLCPPAGPQQDPLLTHRKWAHRKWRHASPLNGRREKRSSLKRCLGTLCLILCLQISIIDFDSTVSQAITSVWRSKSLSFALKKAAEESFYALQGGGLKANYFPQSTVHLWTPSSRKVFSASWNISVRPGFIRAINTQGSSFQSDQCVNL